jgi:hypothetical protein
MRVPGGETWFTFAASCSRSVQECESSSRIILPSPSVTRARTGRPAPSGLRAWTSGWRASKGRKKQEWLQPQKGHSEIVTDLFVARPEHAPIEQVEIKHVEFGDIRRLSKEPRHRQQRDKAARAERRCRGDSMPMARAHQRPTEKDDGKRPVSRDAAGAAQANRPHRNMAIQPWPFAAVIVRRKAAGGTADTSHMPDRWGRTRIPPRSFRKEPPL